MICNLCADGGCGADCSYARLAAAVAPETFRCDVVVAIERAVAAGVERRIIHDVLRALARQHAPQPAPDDHATAAAKLLDRARRPSETPVSVDVPGLGAIYVGYESPRLYDFGTASRPLVWGARTDVLAALVAMLKCAGEGAPSTPAAGLDKLEAALRGADLDPLRVGTSLLVVRRGEAFAVVRVLAGGATEVSQVGRGTEAKQRAKRVATVLDGVPRE